MNETQREILLDILTNIETPEKIKISLENREGVMVPCVTITYEDCDDEWYKELLEAEER